MSALAERIIAARDQLKRLVIKEYGIIADTRDILADAANAIVGQEALLKAENAARLDLQRLAADECARADTMRDLLTRARWYVTDALDAHEHSDGRELLKEIDAAFSTTLQREGSEGVLSRQDGEGERHMQLTTRGDPMADLKPCPFCEGSAEAQQHPGTKLKPHVTCVECGADITETTLAAAIHRWNTRSPVVSEEMTWLADHRDLELAFRYPDIEEEGVWTVWRRSGGRSDQEWTEVATGETPAAAIQAARAALSPSNPADAP